MIKLTLCTTFRSTQLLNPQCVKKWLWNENSCMSSKSCVPRGIWWKYERRWVIGAWQDVLQNNNWHLNIHQCGSTVTSKPEPCNRDGDGRDGATKQTQQRGRVHPARWPGVIRDQNMTEILFENVFRWPSLSLLGLLTTTWKKQTWKWNTFQLGHSKDMLRVVIWCKSSFWRDLGMTLSLPLSSDRGADLLASTYQTSFTVIMNTPDRELRKANEWVLNNWVRKYSQLTMAWRRHF